jgi:hypothetical protein
MSDGQIVDGTAFYDSISFNGLWKIDPVEACVTVHLIVQAIPSGDVHSVGDPFAVPCIVNPVASTDNEANLSGDPAISSCVHSDPFVDVQIVSLSP